MVDDQIGVRVVIFRDGDGWVAQCLEHDICAQGNDVKTVQSRILDTLHFDLLESLRRHNQPFAGLPPAPKWAVEMWKDDAETFFVRGEIAAANERKSVPFEMALCA